MGKRTTSCRWCGLPITQLVGVGRTRQFCRDSHRTSYHIWVRQSDVPVTLRDLIRRDGPTCGICSGPMDLAASGDLAPTIDHIVPVARGGTKVAANLQPAHRLCNSRKCDRIDFVCLPIGSEGDSQPQLPGFSS